MTAKFRRWKNRLGFRMRMGWRLPQSSRRRTCSLRPGKILFFLLTALCLFYLGYIYLFQFRPILLTLATTEANTHALQAVNQSVAQVMQDTSYEDMVSLMKGEGERVTAVVSNIVAINRLKSQLAVSIDQSIQNIGYFSVQIPVGNLLGIDTLSGIGPQLKIGILSDGVTKVDFVNKFDAAGINQTRHQIQLDVDAVIHIMIPNSGPVTATVKTQIPVAETVIVGDIPQAYTNLETQESMIRDDILELQ